MSSVGALGVDVGSKPAYRRGSMPGGLQMPNLKTILTTKQLSAPRLLTVTLKLLQASRCSFTVFYLVLHKKTNVDVGKRGGVPAARHHEKSGNSRKLSGPSVFGLKHEIT